LRTRIKDASSLSRSATVWIQGKTDDAAAAAVAAVAGSLMMEQTKKLQLKYFSALLNPLHR
jgi:hypothetical protein